MDGWKEVLMGGRADRRTYEGAVDESEEDEGGEGGRYG